MQSVPLATWKAILRTLLVPPLWRAAYGRWILALREFSRALVQPSRLPRRLRRELRFRGRYLRPNFQCRSNHSPTTQLVRNLPSEKNLQHGKDGQPGREDVESRLAGPLASGPFWARARSSSSGKRDTITIAFKKPPKGKALPKDKRRKHHHRVVTLFYADGEKFKRVYIDHKRAQRFADRQKKSLVVARAAVTLFS
jgi:hypothetical protein